MAPRRVAQIMGDSPPYPKAYSKLKSRVLLSAVDDACSCLSLLVQRKTLGGGEIQSVYCNKRSSLAELLSDSSEEVS